MNRAIEIRKRFEVKRSQLTDLRDSDTLCDDSDMVIFIHRLGYYEIFQDYKGNDLCGMPEIIIAKLRNSALVDGFLRFNGELVM